ncbi:MAG: N-acetylmuramoyl-L-alanine amidase [Cytophagales bacterium]
MKVWLLGFITISLFLSMNAQTFQKIELNTQKNQYHHLKLEGHVNSFVVRINKNEHFENSFLISSEDSIQLSENEHNDSETLKGSQLKLLNNPTDELHFYSGEIQGRIEFHFFNTDSPNPVSKQFKTTEQHCEEPESVTQNTWRAGLSNPVGNRIMTPTRHIIIHHSADQNSPQTDYTPIVRSIYLFHTQSNGWDDIGYNYLIAPDGVIFKGRDPQGDARQDNVQGAHLCNRNENTMAICLLGNFNNQLPTIEAMKSLYALAAWKVNLENMDIFGSTLHAIGPTSANLPPALLGHVAGHREGCSVNYTDCPGNLFHKSFDALKDSIQTYASKCTITSLEMELNQFSWLKIGEQLFQIPAKSFQNLKIISLSGETLINESFKKEINPDSLQTHQMYLVFLHNHKESYSFKFAYR